MFTERVQATIGLGLIVFVVVRLIRTMLCSRKNKYTGSRNAAGQMHGRGKLCGSNGDVYIGSFKAGRFDGKGVYQFSNGVSSYDGKFQDGLYEGQGVEVYTDGSHYTGNFHLGLREGSGEMVYRNGSWYRGLWKAGAKNGYGEMHYAEAGKIVAVFRGEFEMGKRHGRGVFRKKDGTVDKKLYVHGKPVKNLTGFE